MLNTQTVSKSYRQPEKSYSPYIVNAMLHGRYMITRAVRTTPFSSVLSETRQAASRSNARVSTEVGD